MIDTTPSKGAGRAPPVAATPPGLDLIDRDEVRRIMGGMSRTASYDDPDVAALAVPMTDSERTQWRWLRHEIVGLVQTRIAKRDAQAAAIRAEVAARRERSLARKRITPTRRTVRGKATK